MNTLHPTMSAALRGFSTTPTDADRIQWLEDECQRLRDRLNALPEILREPFEYEKLTRDAITDREPDYCCEAEYTTFMARSENLANAIDWLVDQYMRELEVKVRELEDKS